MNPNEKSLADELVDMYRDANIQREQERLKELEEKYPEDKK